VARVFCLVFVLLVSWLAAQPAFGAAPRFILVSGTALGEPILLDDHSENLRFFTSVVDATLRVPPSDLAGRPSLDLALFWAEGWERTAATEGLEREQADQHGRFYPATDDGPAVIQLPLADQPDPVEAPSVALSILVRHGVPAQVEPDSNGEGVPVLALLGVGVGLAVLSVVLLRRRRLTKARERLG
jgi:hypothetical protein